MSFHTTREAFSPEGRIIVISITANAGERSHVYGERTRRESLVGLTGACAGNLVEWFDFFVYAYTAIYFAGAFFPSGDQTSQLLNTAGVFALGFFMRPLGGWLFGWIADTRGRKISMIISVLLMSFGSLLVAIVPTYQVIGIAAPILLLTARLLQGLSVGAEYGTGATYICEVSSAGRRGFLGSFQYFTIIAGQLIALLSITILQQVLSPAEMKEWGWRVPFFIGAASALVALYLRRSMIETVGKKDLHNKESGSLAGLWRHKGAFFLVLAFTGAGSIYFYTFTTYMQKFLVLAAGIRAETVSIIMTCSLVCFMVFQPLFGLAADRIGIRKNMLLFTGLAAVLVVPLLYALKSTSNPYAAFGLVVCGFLIASFYTAISGLVKADLFPTTIRALGVGFPYALANATLGGTAEYIALWLRSSDIESVYFFYVAALAALGFIASWMMPDLGKHGYLDGDGAIEDNIKLFKSQP
jgi:MHS family alpha-ketoglutarate permease-like MFS transporter